MAGNDEWMPVFTSAASFGDTRHAAHPDHKGPLPASRDDTGSLRIGTAWCTADGSYVIELVAVPVNGKLVMRKPHEDEHPHLVLKEFR
jgi:hypothetical protein